MKRLFAVSAAALFVAALVTMPATLQAAKKDSKTATGTVAAVSVDSITVNEKADVLKLVVDSKTVVVGKGAGTKTAKMKDDKKTPQIVDFVKVGDRVTVAYDSATKHASEVRLAQPVAKTK
jgi:hypothetical protein